MKPPVWPALVTAVVLTALALFFGTSLFSRLGRVAGQRATLERQLQEWSSTSKGHTLQKTMNEWHEYVTQRAAVDAQRQFAALTAAATASLIEQVRKKIEKEARAVEQMQDKFEDEFGRRIVLNEDDPPRYDVGPPPTFASDPLRHAERKLTWTAASKAVAAYNFAMIDSKPDLDRYERELKAQRQVTAEATERWRELSRLCEGLQSRIDAIRREPGRHLPSAEHISARLKSSKMVAIVFALSDGAACLSASTLALAVWLRTALIGGWFSPSRILHE